MDQKTEIIIESLSQLYNKLKQQKSTESQECQITPSNFHSKGSFQHIPKLIIRNIFLYLDYSRDIPSVYQACFFFKEIISSRHYQAGLIHLLSSRSPKQKTQSLPPALLPNESDNIKLQAESEILTKEAALAQLKTANAVKDFLANKIVSQDKTIDKLKKELEKTTDELRIQKQINGKTMTKVSGFQEKYSLAEKTATDALSKIDVLTEHHRSEVERLRNDISESNTEKLELKRHKAALRGEVLRMRTEYQECVQKMDQYNDSVFKLKTFFDAIFSPKIAAVMRNIEQTSSLLNN